MKAFVDLYAALDATTSSLGKRAAMLDYLRHAPPADAAWAVYFLAGGKPRQLVPAKLLKEYAREAAGVPEWLFEESYQAVGDLAETIALLLPDTPHADDASLAAWMEHSLLPLRGMDPGPLKPRLLEAWSRLDTRGRLVFTKLITGSFRVGVSRLLVTRVLAELAGVDAKEIAQRMVGYTDLNALPSAQGYLALIAAEAPAGRQESGMPYPFFLAHPLQADIADFERLLGPPADWLVEWKWDGIRAQLVRRAGGAWLWSRGEELVSDRFPELLQAAAALPEGTVLDGEIVVHKEGRVQPFAQLQQRIGRKTLTPRILRDIPVALLAYDLLELEGQDWRARPQRERRAALDALLADAGSAGLLPSPLLLESSWEDYARLRESSRERGVEGMMLKQAGGSYGVGRSKDVGLWWKWKVDPYSVDAVLIYAQKGHGRRASLYTDYTFAVWDAPPGTPGRGLVPFAKAYSGLTDDEIRQVDAIVRKTTQETFGPVRSVLPTLVFELGFEGIARSTRHKSGIAVRFPRMLRWRQDKPVEEADTLETLSALLPATSAEP
ncbi:ATP-dependent DNA ligase [Pigmentiphaga sp. GD03639]|uniref:DNA ligase (ATP) n=1 Tax=Pigmentiphaga daeguensis TaxID=414049 RepID=A0ABN1CHM4_9BURK|nr:MULTISPECIES: ATP-dependent DNA ligase [unclassified Pigmentiphaga]MDH2237106.1 ATP-dependent DNA ligase [Pigmentiphaga sp. GD03639]OVZ65838.1 ATP-dependent DNA ligase [Pigmentiphaga sp. NML030171]